MKMLLVIFQPKCKQKRRLSQSNRSPVRLL